MDIILPVPIFGYGEFSLRSVNSSDGDIHVLCNQNIDCNSLLVLSFVFNPVFSNESSSKSNSSSSVCVSSEARSLEFSCKGRNSAGSSVVLVSDLVIFGLFVVEVIVVSNVLGLSININEVDVHSFPLRDKVEINS